MGDKEVEYHPDFRMIIQTKLANPHYKPEIQAQATLINFTVTRDGLEDQLLAEVVAKERPDLEKTKVKQLHSKVYDCLLIRMPKSTCKGRSTKKSLSVKISCSVNIFQQNFALLCILVLQTIFNEIAQVQGFFVTLPFELAF